MTVEPVFFTHTHVTVDVWRDEESSTGLRENVLKAKTVQLREMVVREDHEMADYPSALVLFLLLLCFEQTEGREEKAVCE